MAHPSRRLPANTPGDFYVDNTCIDCDTCRWLAPETFFRAGDRSAVRIQPADATSRRRALEAAVACPTACIGTASPAPEMPEVRASFPQRIDGETYYCGYHSSKSFGAASYLLRRPDGNVLVDSPRWSPGLAEGIESLGGARRLFLTHGDDVADHAAWRKRTSNGCCPAMGGGCGRSEWLCAPRWRPASPGCALPAAISKRFNPSKKNFHHPFDEIPVGSILADMTRLSALSTLWQPSAVGACIGRGVAVRTMDHAKRMEKGSGSP